MPTCSRTTSTNPFSKDSKAMIREWCNVELFELCETTPKVQCSHCLLYWNQGIVYCTGGQCLIYSKSRRTVQQTLTGCTLNPGLRDRERRYPWCSTWQDRGTRENTTWLGMRGRDDCKKVDSQGEHFTGIHDRFLRDPVYRESQLAIGWSEQRVQRVG